MKDETYAFISDVKEKNSTARSARHTRTHCGKGGRVRLPSDNLSKKELQKMNGECKSYRLNDPLTREQLLAMPDDLKITYIKAIRHKYNVPDSHLGKAMGFSQQRFSKLIARLGLSRGKATCGNNNWDKEGFYAWWHGVDALPTPVPEEPTQEEKKQIFFGGTENLPEDKIHWVEPESVKTEAPETFMEDDLPFDLVPTEPDPIYPKLPELHIALCAEIDELKKRVDELLKVNEELKAVHEKDKAEVAWLRTECDSLRNSLRMREAQLEIVQLIFGGNKHE